ncbi:MAG TPA: FecR domain-containing protein [Thermoanaerobaculia bacterium]|nr:FecR domain-containing protein [Thermoanaerobaculia bacterium]
MPARKAARQRRDWYSVSVETVKGASLLLLSVAIVALVFFGYKTWERQSLQRDAAAVIDEASGLLQRLRGEKRAVSFASEFTAARLSLQEAQTRFAKQEFRGALESGERSRNVLLSILDALALRGDAGQARFISIEGEVEYRRGDGGEWQEARSRVQLQPGDYVRTSEGGSAEIMFLDGSLYTVRPNTQFIVSAGSTGRAEQSIEMEYGWVNLSTSQKPSNVRTPGAVARVREESEAFVAVDKATNQGRFGAYRGSVELSSKGGLTRQIGALEEVVQTGDLLAEAKPMPSRPEPLEPGDNQSLDLEQTRRLVLSWSPVGGATRYALQVSRNHLFVDNIIDVENRSRARATLGLRGEGTFQWRVAAFGPDGVKGPWSLPWRFRVTSTRTAGGERKDTTPPELDLEDVKTYGSIFMVAGRSEPGARIEVNGEQVKSGVDGAFTKPVQLTKEGWNIIEVRARDAWGNETVRRHRVFVESP